MSERHLASPVIQWLGPSWRLVTLLVTLAVSPVALGQVRVFYEGDLPNSVLPPWIVLSESLKTAEFRLSVRRDRTDWFNAQIDRYTYSYETIPAYPTTLYKATTEDLFRGVVRRGDLQFYDYGTTYYVNGQEYMYGEPGHVVAPESVGSEPLRSLFGDTAPPSIHLHRERVRGQLTTSAEYYVVSFDAQDDIGVVKVSVRGRDTVISQVRVRTKQLVDSLEVPLALGVNHIIAMCHDWLGKGSSDSVDVFRRRREPSADSARPEQPALVVLALSLDGNSAVVGGREEGVKVTVSNSGAGAARWVRVTLEGDEYLTRQWGSERNLEDIKPGESKTATFSLLMPTELERRQAKVRVVVKEGRGYSPTEIPELTLNLVPADKTSRPVPVVEDVDSDIPSAGAKRSGSSALIIGVSQYRDMPLKYARNDAEVFRQYATGVLGISEVRVLLDADATGGKVRGLLKDWMKKKHGLKVVFFAGHGASNPENLRDLTPYLVPADGDLELISTLISTAELPDWCSDEQDTLLLVYDACMAGGDNRPGIRVAVPEQGAITLAAAEGSQPSREYDAARHGYFTYYTLLGLRGKADENHDGWVTTTELHKYVSAEVSTATNQVQVPVLRPEKEIRLGRYR